MGEAVEVVREALANARRVSQTRDTRSVIAPQESIRALLAERDALLVLLEEAKRVLGPLVARGYGPSADEFIAARDFHERLSRLNEDKPNG
jgi:hypothetical protein